MNYKKYVKREIFKYPFLTKEERKELLNFDWAGMHALCRRWYIGKFGEYSRYDILKDIKRQILQYALIVKE